MVQHGRVFWHFCDNLVIKGVEGLAFPSEYLAAWYMYQRTGHALSEITRIMGVRTRQFAKSSFTVMGAK